MLWACYVGNKSVLCPDPTEIVPRVGDIITYNAWDNEIRGLLVRRVIWVVRAGKETWIKIEVAEMDIGTFPQESL